MPSTLDQTHDSQLTSWVKDANGHPDFPIQNLPFGTFIPPDGDARGGIAIGDHILDLRLLQNFGLLTSEPALQACASAIGPTLNPLLALGSKPRIALRREVSALLAAGANEYPHLFHAASDCELHLPATIGDYTDFYAGIHHATNVGKLFRPEQPLLPNYKWVPIGYHGRASSIRPSGEPVHRPSGQRKLPTEDTPTFGPARNLDFELELGIWIGPGNDLACPIAIDEAHDHIAGYCLLNDWSARDLQTWEYQPLGPFLAKSFHTTISPWIVTPEALAPFRTPQTPRDAADPRPLSYLWSDHDQQNGALDLNLEISLLTPQMRQKNLPPQRLSRTNSTNLYWTPQQLLTHHTSNGCNLRPGDLLGTGTISSPTPDGFGSLLELTQNGKAPLTLTSGEQRHFLQAGDEVILRASASYPGHISIGFGECRAIITD
jgi:fumarylacetoacetase